MLFVNAGADTVHIGTNTGAELVNISQTGRSGIALNIVNADSGNSTNAMFNLTNNADQDFQIRVSEVGATTKSAYIGPSTATQMNFSTSIGSLNRDLYIDSASLVVNQDSRDYDFRVESDSNTHQLAVDAERNNVLINNSNTVTNSDNGSVIVGKGAVYYNQVLSMPSPYTGNVQIDLDYSSWGSNNTIAAVDVMILTRQFGNTSGIAMGKMFATNSGAGGTFATFTTTDITTSNCTFTASSPNNYRLRLVVNPSNNTDQVSIVLTIPTLSTSSLSAITAQIV